MLGLILLLHFGSFHLVALAWRRAGVDARPIMRAPAAATSLSSFWGHRWNLGFRQLTHAIVFKPVRRRLGLPLATLLAFAVSGLIHDLVISLPARGGYGLPTAYFVLQGLGVLAERSLLCRRIGLDYGLRGWIFTAMCTAGPVYWCFHPAFVLRVMIPFLRAVGAI
jgi:alginate O-acetyltransferase complex protein AlgI